MSQKTIRLVIILAVAYILVGIIFFNNEWLTQYAIGKCLLVIATVFLILSCLVILISGLYKLGRKLYFWQQGEQDNY